MESENAEGLEKFKFWSRKMLSLRNLKLISIANLRFNSTKAIGILGVPFDKGKVKGTSSPIS